MIPIKILNNGRKIVVILWTVSLLLVQMTKIVFAADQQRHTFVVEAQEYILTEFSDQLEGLSCTFTKHNHLTCQSDTQEFDVHSVSKTGTISKQSHKAIGPNRDGFIFNLSIYPGIKYQGAATYPQIFKRPYWETYGNIYPIPGEVGYIHLRLAYGQKFPKEHLNAMIDWVARQAGSKGSLIKHVNGKADPTVNHSSADALTKPIIFTGDSHIALNDWNSFLNRSDVQNLGVVGHRTKHVLEHLDEIISLNPAKVFMMVGINDHPSTQQMEFISANYKKIFYSLSKKLPKTQLFVHSVLPINYNKLQQYYPAVHIDNKDIERLNEIIKQQARQYGVIYIEMYYHFLDNGQLKDDWTNDGLHLNRKGYRQWLPFIREHVQ